jgi:hypothetical protein
MDRLLSLLVPLQRFRCTLFQCQWVGNIRMDEADLKQCGLSNRPTVKGSADCTC